MLRSTVQRIQRTDRGWELPAIANLHSHAFQRAMAGMAEQQGDSNDSFWTWRETMYAMAARFTPELLHAVAAQLYAEMLEAGYSSVCEFHYLHHQPDGIPYADPAAMSQALIQAAHDTGIRLTLLPVLYMAGGFDGRALSARQKRFNHSADSYLRLFQALRAQENPMLHIGCALHSLRAVPPEAMHEILSGIPKDSRIHIHIAEQVAEVEECIAVRGTRPVRWLLENAQVDAHWTLVHATHLDTEEIRAIAASGATVAICPTTEANLGDGLFPLRNYMDAQGNFGIGSDSHISVSPVEELRWLEYGQRLRWQRRNIAAQAGGSVGEALLHRLYASAQAATGFSSVVEDVIVLDPDRANLIGATASDITDRWLFSGNRSAIKEVNVAGRQLVRDGMHIKRKEISRHYQSAIAELLAV